MAASNEFGVVVSPIDYTKPGTPTTKVYHGTSIEVGGVRIGRINSWSPQVYSRAATHVWEINRDTWGRPVDIVPGNNEGYTISMARTEVWDQEIEIEFGYDLFDDLMDQTFPFEGREFLFKGSAVYRQWLYAGCWFTDRNESEVAAQGDGIISVNASIQFVNRSRLQ